MPGTLGLLFGLILNFLSVRYVSNIKFCFKFKTKLVENTAVAVGGKDHATGQKTWPG